ncbi:MAG: lysophospholipid acyltransferase family protein [Patescibacteria group bacterium]
MSYTFLRSTVMRKIRNRVNRVEGVEFLPKEGGFIIAPNHHAFYDGPALVSVVEAILRPSGRMIYSIMKYQIYQRIGGSVAGAWLGAISVNPHEPQKTLEPALDVLRRGNVILIFPHGGMVSEGGQGVQEGKTGAVRLAMWSGLPIIPAAVVGPAGFKPLMAVRNFFHASERVNIRFGAPLIFPRRSPDQVSRAELRQGTTQLLSAIEQLRTEVISKSFSPIS